jgi:hypothetical protein
MTTFVNGRICALIWLLGHVSEHFGFLPFSRSANRVVQLKPFRTCEDEYELEADDHLRDRLLGQVATLVKNETQAWTRRLINWTFQISHSRS